MPSARAENVFLRLSAFSPSSFWALAAALAASI